MSDQDLYFGDVLQSFSNGVQLELRVKLAIEFLKSPGAIEQASGGPDALARFALALADALLVQSTEAGLMKALPEDSELTQPTRRHIERQIRAADSGAGVSADRGAADTVGARGGLEFDARAVCAEAPVTPIKPYQCPYCERPLTRCRCPELEWLRAIVYGTKNDSEPRRECRPVGSPS